MAAGVDAVIAVGVNCTDPAGVGPAVSAAAGTGTPVVVYPNSGERWDPAARRWTGRPGVPVAGVRAWVTAGARLVGGCCRIDPGSLRSIADAVRTVCDTGHGHRATSHAG